MAGFNLDDYEPVEDRLAKFWEKYPDGRIYTSVEYASETHALVHASVYKDGASVAFATGLARAVYGLTGQSAQAKAPVEDAETSAIGRALANAGFSTSKRASREEMARVQPPQDQVTIDYSDAVAGWEDERKAILRDEWDFPFSITAVPERSMPIVAERVEAVAMRDIGDVVDDLAERLHAEFQASTEPF